MHLVRHYYQSETKELNIEFTEPDGNAGILKFKDDIYRSIENNNVERLHINFLDTEHITSSAVNFFAVLSVYARNNNIKLYCTVNSDRLARFFDYIQLFKLMPMSKETSTF